VSQKIQKIRLTLVIHMIPYPCRPNVWPGRGRMMLSLILVLSALLALAECASLAARRAAAARQRFWSDLLTRAEHPDD
jgi:hypothetical protein